MRTELPAGFTDIPVGQLGPARCLLVDGPPKELLVIDTQNAIDPKKPTLWLYWAAQLHEQHKCPTVVIVLTQSREVEEWACQPVILNKHCKFVPVVIGPNALAEYGISDLGALPASSLFSMITTGKLPAKLRTGKQTLARRILPQPPGETRLSLAQKIEYIDLILGVLKPKTQRQLSEKMRTEHPEFHSIIFNEIYEKGVAHGAATARVEAKLQTLRGNLTLILDARRLNLNKAQSALLEHTADPDLLTLWLSRAATATDAHEVFGPPSK